MEKNFWQKKWDLNEIGFHQKETSPLLEKYLNKIIYHNGTKSHCLIPLSGKTNDIIYLKNYFSLVTGVEIIKKAVESFFSENNFKPVQKENCYTYENIEIIHDDFFNLPNKTKLKYDFVFDRASIIALPENLRFKYVNTVKSLLGPRFTIFLISIEYNSPDLIGPPFSVPEDEIHKHYAEFKIEKLYEKEIPTLSPKFKNIDVLQKLYIIENH